MPLDANGKVLKVGDEVVIRGKLTYVGQIEGDLFCNCTVELAGRMPGAPDRVESMSALNTVMVEKVESEADAVQGSGT